MIVGAAFLSEAGGCGGAVDTLSRQGSTSSQRRTHGRQIQQSRATDEFAGSIQGMPILDCSHGYLLVMCFG